MRRNIFPSALALAFTVLVSACLLTPAARAAGYLEFDGIPGESASNQFEGWIEIDSIQFGANRAIAWVNGSPRPGSVVVSDVVVTKRIDRASPLLFLAAVQGAPKMVKIHFTKHTPDGETVYLRITLHDVLVSSFSTSGSAEFSEEVSLLYTRIDIEYIPETGNPVAVTHTIQAPPS